MFSKFMEYYVRIVTSEVFFSVKIMFLHFYKLDLTHSYSLW